MHRVARGALLVAGTVLAACGEAPARSGVAGVEALAVVGAAREGAIPDQYIVTLADGVDDVPGTARRLAAAHGGELGFVYEHALRGFSVRLPASAAEALARNPTVTRVEQDQVMRASAVTQTNATWGLDRIDQRALPLSGTYTYDPTGAGVNAYIIDTGIRLTHADFGGRAVTGYDAVTAGGSASDCNGHGTHVAGTVGGATWGVAKGATLRAVRVLDCGGSGTTSGVIAGVDWVTGNHVKPAVANMSLGGGASSTLDQAVQNSITAGVTYAIAAGNGDFLGRQLDACTQSPARVAAAITIGATGSSDAKASWSNYGNCVDFFAPGVSITSAWYQGDTQTNTISGTSMAAPHVAGAAALYLQANPGATPQQVRDALYAMTTKGIVTSSSTANNHLLYTADLTLGTQPPPPPPPPTGLSLSATGYKTKGLQTVDLTWSGSGAASVDVIRNNVRITTTANDGAHTDNIGVKGAGSYSYKVCEAGTTTCSNAVTVTF